MDAPSCLPSPLGFALPPTEEAGDALAIPLLKADDFLSWPRPQDSSIIAGPTATRPQADNLTARLARQATFTSRLDALQFAKASSLARQTTSLRLHGWNLVLTRYNAELTGPQQAPRSGKLSVVDPG
jgi:hypothetical protein